MKVVGPVSVGLAPGGLRITPDNGMADWRKMVKAIEDKRATGKPFVVRMTLELDTGARSQAQVASVFTLVSALFWAQEGRLPSESEKQSLYEDLKDAYATRVDSTIVEGQTRPKGLSEMSMAEAAEFIGKVLEEVQDHAPYLRKDAQYDVKAVWEQWQMARGAMDSDPLDDIPQSTKWDTHTSRLWRERHPACDACGQIHEDMQIAHIVSRGADKTIENSPWNWLHLGDHAHKFQHTYGWPAFLKKWPHLKPRVERARRMAAELESKR